MSEDSFIELCGEISTRHKKTPEEALEIAQAVLRKKDIRVGMPLFERLKLAKIDASEREVIQNLHEQGLLPPEDEDLLFDGGEDDPIHV